MSPDVELSPSHARAASAVQAATAVIRVVLADDHELMRARLRALLREDDRLDLIADTADLGVAIRRVLLAHPDVLVLDMSMASGSTIEAIRGLRADAPGTRIVVLNMDASAALACHCFEAGAMAYVLKDTADAELAEAVLCAARAERYLSPRVTEALAG